MEWCSVHAKVCAEGWQSGREAVPLSGLLERTHLCPWKLPWDGFAFCYQGTDITESAVVFFFVIEGNIEVL